MPHLDPERRRVANRDAQRRYRARHGKGLAPAAKVVARSRRVDAAELPDPPSRDFLLRVLGVQALEGNVAAIRILLEEDRRERAMTPLDGLEWLDELAERRREASP